VAAVSTPWAPLNDLYQRAAQERLHILVWGPAPGDSVEARKRVELRDALIAAGHSAAFSEELVPADGPRLSPMKHELLQAKVADLIVVLYTSRGVQSEVDQLLQYPEFARKAVVLIATDVYENVFTTVASGVWEDLKKFATEIIEYTPEQLERCEIVGKACETAELARYAVYIESQRPTLR
jgi:hypothetical protein